MIVNRIEERSVQKQNKNNEQVFISIYDVISRIADEVVKNHKDIIADITLSKSPKSVLEKLVLKIIANRNYKVAEVNRPDLVKEVIDHILGYGIIQKYIDLPDFNNAYINGPDNVWVKCGNKMERVDVSFGSNENLLSYIQTTIQANLKGEINENKALVKFEDKENKLRIICGISPVTTLSPTIVFRKHRDDAYSLKELVDIGMLTEEQAEDLVRYAQAGANIMFVGKGGAGKTTLMRAVLEELNKETRILVMEEHPELFLKHPNAIHTLVKRNEHGQIYGIREISDMGLLMSIDAYVYGEIREGEAMTFFNGAFAGNQTFNTAHAGSAKKALRKMMINMKMSGTNLSDEVLLDILYESVNIIVYLDSFTVAEMAEINSEGKDKYNYLWKFNIKHREATFIQGEHIKTGFVESEDLIIKLMQSNLLKEGDLDAYNIDNITSLYGAAFNN
ncbi:Flp pilus assembly complex ATPase component TadA [Alkaliphilus sp. MSJ-5]|uniref:Flp pilus assembly complex ATPase component TadA n=1 Tax=Alkaliphilus flagellatus TaxID=2841507 RepID=A0ABS6G343_9FIRM|nr:ATPase, T2SS/T4P/T4SS family [Alkaliphilus flagellatus]MBU5676902.1 Flp pilus assembly complex ATPase component TadA [Alkaliphilus flagellatus]